MFVNPYMLLTIVGGALMYIGGQWLSAHMPSVGRRRLLEFLAVCACLPALSFVLYYAHFVKEPWWYVEFRSIPGIEALAMCWGWPAGWFSPRAGSLAARILCRAALLACALLLMLLPFCKPVVIPLEAATRVGNVWEDEVCLQTTSATCGPASLATIFAAYGERHSEREIARACYSCSSGTELWYLIRFARQHGLRVFYIRPRSLSDVPAPAILGTTLDANADQPVSGHFITLLGQSGQQYIIGDPLTGRKTLGPGEFLLNYGTLRDAICFTTEDEQ